MTPSERQRDPEDQDDLRKIFAKKPQLLIAYEKEITRRLLVTNLVTGCMEFIKVLGYIPIAWLAYKAIDALAGKETLISGELASIVVAFMSGLGGGTYLVHRIKDRHNRERTETIQRQREYIKELEHKIQAPAGKETTP